MISQHGLEGGREEDKAGPQTHTRGTGHPDGGLSHGIRHTVAAGEVEGSSTGLGDGSIPEFCREPATGDNLHGPELKPHSTPGKGGGQAPNLRQTKSGAERRHT